MGFLSLFLILNWLKFLQIFLQISNFWLKQKEVLKHSCRLPLHESLRH